jgi:hypothetical protein
LLAQDHLEVFCFLLQNGIWEQIWTTFVFLWAHLAGEGFPNFTGELENLGVYLLELDF